MDINTISVKTPQFYKCQYGRVELLNDENYPDWSNTLIFFLTADKTWSIVVGTEEAPQALPANASAARHAEYRKELLEFQARSARACSMIISSVTPSYKCFLFGKTNPKDMWDILKNRLDSLTSNSGPFIRRDQFLNERHTGKGPISTFFARLQQYQAQLASTRLPISDFELMSHVLKGDTLDSRFKSTVKTLRLQLETLTWNTLTQILINEDLQQAADTVAKANATALVGNSRSNKNKGRNKGKDQTNSRTNSDNRGRNQNSNSNRSGYKRNWSPSSTNDSDNDHDRRRKRSKHSNNCHSHNSSDEIICYYCLKKGHIAPECKTRIKAEKLQRQRQSQSSNSNAHAANTHSDEPTVYANIADSTVLACTTLLASQDPVYRSAWHLDSGATDHIANDRKAFLQIRRLATPIGIRLGDDKVIWAYEKGSVRIQTLNDSKFRDFTLTDVLYAKELGTNLISTRKLGLKGCKTILNPYDQGADIFDKNDNWLGTADIMGGMYCLRILKIISSS